jgi:hypothetical protein
MRNYRAIKAKRFYEQNGRCHYCEQPMWLDDEAAFARRYGLTPRQTRHLQATAEHLDPLGAGGADEPHNIAAACSFCNRHRHRFRPLCAPDPEQFARHVRGRLAKGRWHGLRLA